MKKRLTIIFILVMALFCMPLVSMAAGDPSVTLVNPASNSTVYSSNILLSVKITQPKTIK